MVGYWTLGPSSLIDRSLYRICQTGWISSGLSCNFTSHPMEQVDDDCCHYYYCHFIVPSNVVVVVVVIIVHCQFFWDDISNILNFFSWFRFQEGQPPLNPPPPKKPLCLVTGSNVGNRNGASNGKTNGISCLPPPLLSSPFKHKYQQAYTVPIAFQPCVYAILPPVKYQSSPFRTYIYIYILLEGQVKEREGEKKRRKKLPLSSSTANY